MAFADRGAPDGMASRLRVRRRPRTLGRTFMYQEVVEVTATTFGRVDRSGIRCVPGERILRRGASTRPVTGAELTMQKAMMLVGSPPLDC